MNNISGEIKEGKNHEYFMRQALREASKAFDKDEVPIGAVIVMNEKIIARGYNQVEALKDATAHAEIIALTSAFNFLGSKYVPEATIYITLEPCAMCCGALFWSKIARVVYGASDPKHGGLSLHQNLLHPKTLVVKDVLSHECVELIQNFFIKKR